jgi:cystathionine beta-lyase
MTLDFDFDAPPERRGSDSLKWAKYAGRDVLPMWVADMDFAAPPAVLAALHARVQHGVFGYGKVPASLIEAVVQALWRDYAWQVDPAWLLWLPGLVSGLNAVCRAIGEPGDAVLTATPIYPPLLTAPAYSQREVQAVPLQRDGATWIWDMDAADAAVTARTRLLLLCSPHNPVGRVYTEAELRQVAELAERHDLVICSDEIHSGLVLAAERRHIPIAALDMGFACRTITLMAPSKTYNIPGLCCGFAVVPSPELRRQLRLALRGIVPDVNVLAFAAAEAAYRSCEPWRKALIDYLRANARTVEEALGNVPGLATTAIEATYLSWIDARGLKVRDAHALFENAGIGLSDGTDFGAPGFLRLNFGCTRSTLRKAIDRMRVAVCARALP